jgi:hypothetical protein
MSRRRSPAGHALRRATIVWLVALAIAPRAHAAPPGSTSGAFAPIPIGADLLGSGGAGTVLERGAFATFWNPANLALARQHEVAIDYTNLFGLDIARHTAIAVAWHRAPARPVLDQGELRYRPTGRQTGFGIELGVTSVDFDPETYREVTPAFAFGTTVARGTAVGASLRILSATSDFDATSAIGYTLDLGFTLDRYEPWSVGVATRHLLSGISWEDDATDRLPAAITGGVAYRGLHPGLVLAAEATMSEDQSPIEVARVGGEWTPSLPIALRAGLAYRQDRGEDRYEPAFGVGTHLGGLYLDYARVGDDDTLDPSHRISLRFRF